MPLRTVHLINTTLDDTQTSIAGTHRFQGAAPKRATLQVQMVESGSGASVALTVEVSPDGGATLITYDKLIFDVGVDAPGNPPAYDETEDDIVSFSPEDVMNFVKVTLTGASLTSANYFDVDVWLVYDY